MQWTVIPVPKDLAPPRGYMQKNYLVPVFLLFFALFAPLRIPVVPGSHEVGHLENTPHNDDISIVVFVRGRRGEDESGIRQSTRGYTKSRCGPGSATPPIGHRKAGFERSGCLSKAARSSARCFQPDGESGWRLEGMAMRSRRLLYSLLLIRLDQLHWSLPKLLPDSSTVGIQPRHHCLDFLA